VQTPPEDDDDWFAGADTEERPAEAPPEDDLGAYADDWLTEDDLSPLQRRSPLQKVDRRVLVAAVALVVLLLAGLAAGGVFSSGSSKKPSVLPPTTAPAATSLPTVAQPTTTVAPQASAPTTTLKPGDTGAQVVALQKALVSLGFLTGKADGDYGPATTAAVTKFQTAHGLTADGVLGPATLSALKTALAP